jgi:hypothetical protein
VARTRHCRRRRCGRRWATRSCGSPRGDGETGGARMAVVDGELTKEVGGRGKHLPRGVVDRRLRLQVVTTRRRVGEVFQGSSTEEEGS